ncbi:T9SS type A sorting domain-containing protein [Brumimicrobium glaciale]|uniref:T9SS type A sorting domain-containing protein n=1 Tax=Brumimicrobium glaciale TaxID=200475 RepID=A0A4Q4KIG0_9FLAO|nr:T9SS type A sorting domain-containing protein [Brumimicrobium glaciale]RYM31499.1 T9SS type A sorting domain-containing protein [Brumimicrobium glaciale]
MYFGRDDIIIYPNPASDFTSIKWEIYDELKNSHYRIFDLNGREMGSGAIEENEGEQVIDTRSLTNRVYIINIYNGGIMKMNSKLIVDKEK